jgi:hypothetical protein
LEPRSLLLVLARGVRDVLGSLCGFRTRRRHRGGGSSRSLPHLSLRRLRAGQGAVERAARVVAFLLRALGGGDGGVRGGGGTDRNLPFLPQLGVGRSERVLRLRLRGSPALSLALRRVGRALRSRRFIFRATLRALGERSRGFSLGDRGVAFALRGDPSGFGFGEAPPGVSLGGVRRGDAGDGVSLELPPRLPRTARNRP